MPSAMQILHQREVGRSLRLRMYEQDLKDKGRVSRAEKQESRLKAAVDNQDCGWGFPLLGGDFKSPVGPMGVTIRDILRAAAIAGEITYEQITGRRVARVYSRPRQVAYLLAKELTGLSLPKIAYAVGRRDHTSVMHGINKALELKESDREFRILYNRARKIAGAK